MKKQSKAIENALRAFKNPIQSKGGKARWKGISKKKRSEIMRKVRMTPLQAPTKHPKQ